VRTTLTLDDDVAILLQKEIRRTGQPMKQAVNRCLRMALTSPQRRNAKPFKVTPIPMALPSFTKVEDLLDLLEGPDRR
jgi:hypothetical protein